MKLIFMKGISLPSETIVIIALAVIVLLAVITLIYIVYPSTAETISLESAKSNACQTIASLGCRTDPRFVIINNYDADGDGNRGSADAGPLWDWSATSGYNDPTLNFNDNLAALCVTRYGITNDAAAGPENCRQFCGCPATGS